MRYISWSCVNTRLKVSSFHDITVVVVFVDILILHIGDIVGVGCGRRFRNLNLS